MIDLPLAVVGDRLESWAPGDGRRPALAHLRLAVLGIGRHHLDVEGFLRRVRRLAGGIFEHYQAVDRVVALVSLEAVANERILAGDGSAGRCRRAREGDLESALRRFELRPRLRFLPGLRFALYLLGKGAHWRDGRSCDQRCSDK